MAQDIKRKIVLEGEKEFNAAIKESGRNIKTLTSEMKAETAELGRNATEQQKAEVKYKSLQKQIQEQEKIVKNLREALAQAKQQYGDNEDVVQKWEQKLNDARTTLGNMKNDLDDLGDGLGKTRDGFKQAADGAAETVTATKSVADALGEIGNVGDSISGAMENIFTGIVSGAGDVVSELWGMISSTAARANNWTDIAGYWNTDPQKIQQYARAVQASANSFDDLNSAVSKIVLGGKGKKITELIGVSDVNYQDDWAYAMAVMDRMAEMSQSGMDMTPAYEEIFGEERAQKVMDLINDWGEIQKNLKEFNGNETGYGLTDEQMQQSNDLWVQINRLETKWDALKDKFAAGFGTITGSLLINAEDGLDAIADFLNADTPEEREQALEKFRANVEEFFTKAAEALRAGIGILHQVGEEFQESEDPQVHAVGDIMVNISNALQWMVDNQEAVKTAFETIFGFYLTAKLASVAGKLASIIMQIEAIKAFSAMVAAGAGGAAAAGAGGAATAGTGFLPLLAGAGGFVIGMLPAGSAGDQEDSLYDKNGDVTDAGRRNGLPARIEDYDDYINGRYVEDFVKSYVDAVQKGADETVREAYRESAKNNSSPEKTVQMTQLMDTVDRLTEAGEKIDIEALLANAGIAVTTPEPQTTPAAMTPTQAQLEAAEILWDHLHDRDTGDGRDPYAVFTDAYGTNDSLIDRLDALIEAIAKQADEGNMDLWNLEDLPTNWWLLDPGAWQTGGSNNQTGNNITSSDLQSFRGLPAGILEATRAGAASGVSGIRVTLDGATVGRLVAPYVSESIARDVII